MVASCHGPQSRPSETRADNAANRNRFELFRKKKRQEENCAGLPKAPAAMLMDLQEFLARTDTTCDDNIPYSSLF